MLIKGNAILRAHKVRISHQFKDCQLTHADTKKILKEYTSIIKQAKQTTCLPNNKQPFRFTLFYN